MDGLYTILSRQTLDGVDRFEIRLDAGHDIYRGHFPEEAVTPGVCQLMIVRELASIVAGRTLRYSSIAESKFTAPVRPRSDDAATLDLSLDESTWTVRCTMRQRQGIVLKLKAVFDAE